MSQRVEVYSDGERVRPVAEAVHGAAAIPIAFEGEKLVAVYEQTPAPRPVNKYGRWLVWEDGYSRKLTLREHALWHLGKLKVKR